MICEVGGSSAWNKYVLVYDDKQRPLLVKHFKAYFENYDADGNILVTKTPNYHLGETLTFFYSYYSETATAKNADGKMIEQIAKHRDTRSELTYEEWIDISSKRTRVYYQYKVAVRSR